MASDSCIQNFSMREIEDVLPDPVQEFHNFFNVGKHIK